jgi:hypothetical protein
VKPTLVTDTPLANRFNSNTPKDSSGLLGGELVAKALRNVIPAAELTFRNDETDCRPFVQAGVETVFGYSGGANLPVLDTFHDSPMQFIMNRSEQCCGHAAEGYAKSTGKTGAMKPLREAWHCHGVGRARKNTDTDTPTCESLVVCVCVCVCVSAGGRDRHSHRSTLPWVAMLWPFSLACL